MSQHRPPVVPTLEASLPSETGRSCRVSTVTPSRWFSRCIATVHTYCREPTLYVWVNLRLSIVPKTVSSGIPHTTSVSRGVCATSLGRSSWSREITGEPRDHWRTTRSVENRKITRQQRDQLLSPTPHKWTKPQEKTVVDVPPSVKDNIRDYELKIK